MAYNTFVVVTTMTGYRSVLLRFSLLWSQACFSRRVFPQLFLVSFYCRTLLCEIKQKLVRLMEEYRENQSAENRRRPDFDNRFPQNVVIQRITTILLLPLMIRALYTNSRSNFSNLPIEPGTATNSELRIHCNKLIMHDVWYNLQGSQFPGSNFGQGYASALSIVLVCSRFLVKHETFICALAFLQLRRVNLLPG